MKLKYLKLNKRKELILYFFGLICILIVYYLNNSLISESPITSSPSVYPDQPILNGNRIWANILQITSTKDQIFLEIDYLEANPCWTPGGPPKPDCPNNQDLYLNSAIERIKIPLAADVKIIYCTVNYNNQPVLNAQVSLDTFIRDYSQNSWSLDYYLDINKNQVISIYQRCLP